jgi:hypothetical protein
MAGTEQNHKKFPLWAAVLLAGIGICMAAFCYMASIGPVYYFWARCSADMGVHERVEAFYSPVLKRGPRWLRNTLTEYRDASRIAGYRGEK